MYDGYPASIYPAWDNVDDFDGPEDYALACRIAELAYDRETLPARLKELEQ